jgi:hypothetical protein
MADKESPKTEVELSPVFFGSNRKRHSYISLTTGVIGAIEATSSGALGATSISMMGMGIINFMLYDKVRQEFSSHTNTAITVQIEKVLNWLFHQNVLIPLPDSIRNYLLQHFDMLKLLPLICKRAIDRVGSSSQLSLEVYHDPEIQDEYLTLYVRRAQYDESISKLIDEITAEYQEYLSDSTGWLLVTTDFRPPQ